MELSGSKAKKFLRFSYISENRNFEKNSNISGNGIAKKTSYNSGDGTLHFSAQALKIKKNLL